MPKTNTIIVASVATIAVLAAAGHGYVLGYKSGRHEMFKGLKDIYCTEGRSIWPIKKQKPQRANSSTTSSQNGETS